MRKGMILMLSISVLFGSCSVVMALERKDYRQKKECYLCSRQEDTEASINNNIKGIGILHFNDFSIEPFRICEETPDTSGYTINLDTYGESGSSIWIHSNLDRRIAEITISIGEGSRPQQKEMKRFLCAKCCKKIKQENRYDVAFIDCQTKEIFPIEENTVEFYIGDYAVHRLNSGDNRYSYLIFFAPERQDA